MPELPEIETIRRDLSARLEGRRVIQSSIFDSRLMSSTAYKRWTGTVTHQPWTHFRRRGKYLMIGLQSGWTQVFHLRMTGQLVLSTDSAALKPRLSMTFDDGQQLHFCDQRRFGEIWLLEPGRTWHSDSPPGPDAMNDLDLPMFLDILKGRTTRIQPLLMDQHRLAGVGNIYAQEALFKASIRPSRPAGRINKEEGNRLFDALQTILKSAIEHRGSTSRNYRDALGQAGNAQMLHQVYRKGGQPCTRCRSVLKSTRVGGRGTVYCAQCQK